LQIDARLMEVMLTLSRRSTVPALLVFALLISAGADSTEEGDEDAGLSQVRLEFEGDDDSPHMMDALFDSIDMHVEEPNVRTVISSTANLRSRRISDPTNSFGSVVLLSRLLPESRLLQTRRSWTRTDLLAPE
jgi:hypothetical protein